MYRDNSFVVHRPTILMYQAVDHCTKVFYLQVSTNVRLVKKTLKIQAKGDPAYFCENYIYTFLSYYHLFGLMVILVN